MVVRLFSLAGVALLASSALVSCASNPSVASYAAQSDDTARLRIALGKGNIPRTGAGDGMTALLHTAADCSAPQTLDAVYTIDALPSDHDPNRRSHRKSGQLAMPLGEYDGLEVEELLVDAASDRLVALQFSTLLAGPFGAFTRCNIALEQDFEAGRDYEIVGRFDSPTSCSAVVNEIVAGADGARRVQLASVNNVDNPLPDACFVKL